MRDLSSGLLLQLLWQFQAILAQVSRPVQEVSFVCRLRLCKSWLHASQRMEFVANSRRLVRGHSGSSTSFRAVAAPTEREGKGAAPSAGPRVAVAQGANTGATLPPPSVPTGGNERRTPEEVVPGARARVVKLEAAISAVGESDPTFPAFREALSQARKQAEEACGESSQGGGRCEGQGCHRKDYIDLRGERIAGGTATSCIFLGGSIEDRRTATTYDARGFRSGVGAIEVVGSVVPARTGRVAQRGIVTPAEESRPRK